MFRTSPQVFDLFIYVLLIYLLFIVIPLDWVGQLQFNVYSTLAPSILKITLVNTLNNSTIWTLHVCAGFIHVFKREYTIATFDRLADYICVRVKIPS